MDPCIACLAIERLDATDWQIIDFYRLVRDQVVNITPNEERYDHRPRLEAWLEVGRERGYHGAALIELVDTARFLHETVHGRCPVPALEWRSALDEELRPPVEWPDG